MQQFRWTTAVLVGSWKNTKREALCDALAFGQAVVSPVGGEIITLRPNVTIEARQGS